MNDRKQKTGSSIGDAAWAHNRWPAVGLSAGAGFGLALGVIFWLGWLWTIVLIVGGGFAGCFTGLAAAKLIYRGADQKRENGDLPGGELRPAAEDHDGDTADEDVARGNDDTGGVPPSDREPHEHREDA